jgi:hypothetical protein
MATVNFRHNSGKGTGAQRAPVRSPVTTRRTSSEEASAAAVSTRLNLPAAHESSFAPHVADSARRLTPFARTAPLRSCIRSWRKCVSSSSSRTACGAFAAGVPIFPRRAAFRYACPCHSCGGEFDISTYVAELAAKADHHSAISVNLPARAAVDINKRVACPISALRVSAVAHRVATMTEFQPSRSSRPPRAD